MAYIGDQPPRYEASPEQIGERARFQAMVLAEQRPLNRGATEWFMRAFAGLYTPAHSTGITNELYSTLPLSARNASRQCAVDCAEYFEQTGVLDEMTRDLPVFYPRGRGEADIDGWMIGKMQTHVSTIGTPGIDTYYDRALKQARSMSPPRPLGALPRIGQRTVLRDFTDSREDLLRSVISSFGANIGPVLEGYVAVAPLSDTLDAVRYADDHIA